jgi:hypothetical protein
MSSNSTERNQSAADIEKAEQAALAKTTPDEPLAVGGGPLLLEISNEVRFVVARLQQIFSHARVRSVASRAVFILS